MISDLRDLGNYDIAIVLYPSGSSGEFLAHALSLCFKGFPQIDYSWEKSSRMKFKDCFGRSLNGADEPVADSTVIQRFNQYLEETRAGANDRLIGLSHPHLRSIEFIHSVLPQARVLEITTCHPDSQKFRNMAATEKIGPKQRATHLYKHTGHCFAKHLKIEWKELFVSHTQQRFHDIENFLQQTGDFEKFTHTVNDYVQRNQHLINKL